MNLRSSFLSIGACLFILSLSSCASLNKQATSELVQTATNLVEKGDVISATSILNTVDKMSPDMDEVAELRKAIQRKEHEKASIKEDPLSYSFIDDGIRVEVSGVIRTRSINIRTSMPLAEGETWIVVNTVLKDQANKHHQTRWRYYFRLISKTGEALSPSIPIVIASQNGTPDFIHGNERKEMKIVFQARVSDAPWKLRFSNGVESDLAF